MARLNEHDRASVQLPNSQEPGNRRVNVARPHDRGAAKNFMEILLILPRGLKNGIIARIRYFGA